MNRFDDELRQALRREDPGPDFTRRVLEKVGQASACQPKSWWQSLWPQSWTVRWAALAACLLLVFGGLRYQEHRRVQAEGEAAKEKLVLALRIAGTKLHSAQERVIDLTQ